MLIDKMLEKPHRKTLDKAVIFDIFDAVKYAECGEDDANLFDDPVISPPFDVIWMESLITPSMLEGWASEYLSPLAKAFGPNRRIKRFGILIHGHIYDPAIEKGYELFLKDHTNNVDFAKETYREAMSLRPHRVMSFEPFIMLDDKTIKREQFVYVTGLDELGHELVNGRIIFKPDDFEGAIDENNLLITFAILALVFLNANIKLEKCEPSSRLQKARIKKGKRPLVSYSKIVVFGHEVVHGKGKPIDERAKSKLHAVRGHFKRRGTGIFWWRPFLRGSHEEGVTLSDYEVKP